VKRAYKVALVLILLLVAVTATVSAQKRSLRLGLEFGDPLAVIIVRPAPFDFKVGYDFQDSGWIFVSGDYRIISGYQLIDVLHMFLGVGAYIQIPFDDGDLEFGAQIPVGLQVFLINNVLELFLEVAPTVGFVPTIEAFPRWLGYAGFTILIPRR
jgi:hypothetical protein